MLLKSFYLAMIFLVLATASAIAWANYSAPMLVLDMRNTPSLPKHFYTSSNSLPATLNTTGLADLHIAGSGQFSKLGLQRVLEQLRAKRLTIIDLRQESHGFLNGNAVSWYAMRNAANAGLTMEQIEANQEQLLSQLNNEDEVKVNVIITKTADGGIAKTRTAEFSVHQIATEEEIAQDRHLRYRHIYVQDFHAPTAKQVDRFIRIVQGLPKDQWIYFHCRGGIGRTTEFMAMFDMLHNAKQVSFADILARQHALGGRDLTVLPSPHSFKYKAAIERLEFLKKFYQYAHDNNDNFKTTWTEALTVDSTA